MGAIWFFPYTMEVLRIILGLRLGGKGFYPVAVAHSPLVCDILSFMLEMDPYLAEDTLNYWSSCPNSLLRLGSQSHVTMSNPHFPLLMLMLPCDLSI